LRTVSSLACAAAALLMALPATCKTSTNAPIPTRYSIKPTSHTAHGVTKFPQQGSRPKVFSDWYRAAAGRSYGSMSGANSLRNAWTPINMGGDCSRLESGDYLPEMLDGGMQRWSGQQFPLRVYVDQSGGAGSSASFPAMVQQAMNSWTAISQNRLSFTLVSDPASANIVVQGVPYATASECGDTVTKWTPDANGNQWITHAVVTISTGASANEVAKCTLHELGHALGLKHSSHPGDIMYYQSNPAQVASLGPRDAATINKLYGIN
jgi:predicted Zn-dependent protease